METFPSEQFTLIFIYFSIHQVLFWLNSVTFGLDVDTNLSDKVCHILAALSRFGRVKLDLVRAEEARCNAPCVAGRLRQVDAKR